MTATSAVPKYSCILFVLIFYYFGTFAKLVTTPVNIAVEVGSSCTIPCQTDVPHLHSILWYHKPPNSQAFGNIFSGFVFDSKYKSLYLINKTDLIITSAQTTHAGTYRCEESGILITADAEIIVHTSPPVCQTDGSIVNEYELIAMSCSVNYSGNWEPSMEWQEDQGPVNSGYKSRRAVPGKTVTYILRILGTRNEIGRIYSCTTFYSKTNKPLGTVAVNIPEYRHTWSSPQIDVLYGTDEVKIIPEKTSYSVEDTITCLANGNPAPNYLWEDLDSDTTYAGNKLSLLDIRCSPACRFQCIATNQATGRWNTVAVNFAFSLHATPTSDSNNQEWLSSKSLRNVKIQHFEMPTNGTIEIATVIEIYAVVGSSIGFFVVIVITVLVILCIRRMKQGRSRYEETNRRVAAGHSVMSDYTKLRIGQEQTEPAHEDIAEVGTATSSETNIDSSTNYINVDRTSFPSNKPSDDGGKPDDSMTTTAHEHSNHDYIEDT